MRFLRRQKCAPADGGPRVAPDFVARLKIFLPFLGHCRRRAAYIARTMAQMVSFDRMLLCLSPLAGHVSLQVENTPDVWMARAAECCAWLIPRVWRRRCLFRSLLVLDWAHRSGIDATLNVGMSLGPQSEQGHCWLSIGGRPFCEPRGWPGGYGVLFHQSGNLQYWASLAPDAEALAASGGQTGRMEGRT
jgi:hypothetical protein